MPTDSGVNECYGLFTTVTGCPAGKLRLMRMTLRIAAAAWMLVSVLAAQSSPTYNIGKPTILAFFTPVSQSEPKEAGADEALADFQFYGHQALKPLAKMGVDYKEIHASGFVVKVGEAAPTFQSHVQLLL